MSSNPRRLRVRRSIVGEKAFSIEKRCMILPIKAALAFPGKNIDAKRKIRDFRQEGEARNMSLRRGWLRRSSGLIFFQPTSGGTWCYDFAFWLGGIPRSFGRRDGRTKSGLLLFKSLFKLLQFLEISRICFQGLVLAAVLVKGFISGSGNGRHPFMAHRPRSF